MTPLASSLRRRLAALAVNRTGVAMVEFALVAPVLLVTGVYGVEYTNLAIAHLKVSQVALSLADNSSRVGISPLAVQTLRESDINEVLTAARSQGEGIGLTRLSRITLSSLQTNSSGGQTIKWQRCLGLKSGTGWDSSYGTQGAGASGNAFPGMGPAGARVTSPPNSAVMFVEINYDYQPLVTYGTRTARKLKYHASFVVRDNRDLTVVANPGNATTVMNCDRYTTDVPRRA